MSEVTSHIQTLDGLKRFVLLCASVPIFIFSLNSDVCARSLLRIYTNRFCLVAAHLYFISVLNAFPATQAAIGVNSSRRDSNLSDWGDVSAFMVVKVAIFFFCDFPLSPWCNFSRRKLLRKFDRNSSRHHGSPVSGELKSKSAAALKVRTVRQKKLKHSEFPLHCVQLQVRGATFWFKFKLCCSSSCEVDTFHTLSVGAVVCNAVCFAASIVCRSKTCSQTSESVLSRRFQFECLFMIVPLELRFGFLITRAHFVCAPMFRFFFFFSKWGCL